MILTCTQDERAGWPSRAAQRAHGAGYQLLQCVAVPVPVYVYSVSDGSQNEAIRRVIHSEFLCGCFIGCPTEPSLPQTASETFATHPQSQSLEDDTEIHEDVTATAIAAPGLNV